MSALMPSAKMKMTEPAPALTWENYYREREWNESDRRDVHFQNSPRRAFAPRREMKPPLPLSGLQSRLDEQQQQQQQEEEEELIANLVYGDDVYVSSGLANSCLYLSKRH